MNIHNALAACAVLACLVGAATAPVSADKPKPKAPAAAAAEKTHKWKNFTFQAPGSVAFSAPQGDSDMTNFFHPPDVKPDQPRIRIVFADIDGETVKALEPRGKLLQAQVTTHMGLGKDPDKEKSRTFLGQEIKGGIWSSDYPLPRSFEAYVIPLPSGGRFFLALEHSNVIEEAKAESVFSSLAKTLAVGP